MKFTFLGLIGLLLLSPTLASSKQHRAVVYRNTLPGVAFAGSKSCAASGCHEQICQDFQSVPMGDSMGPANTLADLARVPHPVTVYVKEQNYYLEVTRQGNDLYQTEYQLDEKGNRVHSTTNKLDYRIGGPLTGYTYVTRLGDWMFEAPLSYYVRNNQWELSPGYEGTNMGFGGRPRLWRDPAAASNRSADRAVSIRARQTVTWLARCRP